MKRVVIFIFLIFAGLYTVFPLALALVNSFKTNRELLSNIMSLPVSLNFENYIRSFNRMNYAHNLGNTAAIAVMSVTLIVVFSSMAGWKLCRIKTRFSNFLFSLFIFSMLIPFSSIMIPLYNVVLGLGIKNSLTGLSFVYTGLGVSMAIFLYHGFVKSVPVEMEESASIDGCNSMRIFIHIIFPLLKPVTASIYITNVLWIWNDFLLPLIIISNSRKYTLLLSTNTLFGQYSSDWSAILSALMLAALPVIVFFAIFQKNITKGIAEGAVKG
ncbi:MAG: carbohydrate ABC transporter permease [Treponema sp.]|nr:carbohydrate ABC transporter permease [Treponema sp.]